METVRAKKAGGLGRDREGRGRRGVEGWRGEGMASLDCGTPRQG